MLDSSSVTPADRWIRRLWQVMWCCVSSCHAFGCWQLLKIWLKFYITISHGNWSGDCRLLKGTQSISCLVQAWFLAAIVQSTTNNLFKTFGLHSCVGLPGGFGALRSCSDRMNLDPFKSVFLTIRRIIRVPLLSEATSMHVYCQSGKTSLPWLWKISLQCWVCKWQHKKV